MAKSSMDITSFAGKLLQLEDIDLLREGVRALAQMLMDARRLPSPALGSSVLEWPTVRLGYDITADSCADHGRARSCPAAGTQRSVLLGPQQYIIRSSGEVRIWPTICTNLDDRSVFHGQPRV